MSFFGNVEPADSMQVVKELQAVVAALKANKKTNEMGAVSLAALRDELQRRQIDHA